MGVLEIKDEEDEEDGNKELLFKILEEIEEMDDYPDEIQQI